MRWAAVVVVGTQVQARVAMAVQAAAVVRLTLQRRRVVLQRQVKEMQVVATVDLLLRHTCQAVVVVLVLLVQTLHQT
jgi:hypothetical protein